MRYLLRMIGNKEVLLVRSDGTNIFEVYCKSSGRWESDGTAIEAVSGMTSDEYKEVSEADANSFIRKLNRNT